MPFKATVAFSSASYTRKDFDHMIVAQAPQTGKDLETVIANVQNPDQN